MKVGTLLTIDEYEGPFSKFVELYNKWQDATAFLSVGMCEGKEWDKLIAYGKEHQDEVKELIHEFLSLKDNKGNWMAMDVLKNCCPEVNEKIFTEGYISPETYQHLLLALWEQIFEGKELIYEETNSEENS